MRQHQGCLWGRSESAVEIVPPVPGEEGDTELSVHCESSKPCPSLPCVPWVLCWELSLLIGKDTENWLHFHSGTAPPAFLGLLLLLSSTSICGCTAMSVWALLPWAVGCVLSTHAVGTAGQPLHSHSASSHQQQVSLTVPPHP